MTATQMRLARTTPALLLPLALIISLLGVAVALARVAPSRVTGGVYQVIVGEGPARFTIPTESLTCDRTGDVARCSTRVAGKPLAIAIMYSGYDSSCRADHGDRMVPCASGLYDYGQASNTVWIADGLGATEQDRTQALPWWRTDNGPARAAFALIAALTLAAGLGTYLLSRRARPDEHFLRLPAALGIGALGAVLFGISAMIMAPDKGFGHAWPMVVGPATLIAAAALGLWQYQLGGQSPRRTKAIGAAIATAAYTAIAVWAILIQGGFID